MARGSRLTGWRLTDCGGVALSPLSPVLAHLMVKVHPHATRVLLAAERTVEDRRNLWRGLLGRRLGALALTPAHTHTRARTLNPRRMLVAGRVLAGRVRGGSGSAARTWLSNEKKSR